MRSQINLGQVFGIRIGLHYSWFIIALLIVFSLSAQFHTSRSRCLRSAEFRRSKRSPPARRWNSGWRLWDR